MKKKLTVKEFVKNNWLLIVALVALLLISLVVYIIVFWGDGLNDAGAWGSLVAGIFTYIGSSFLGIVVFYNTQSQQRQKEIEDQINVKVKCLSSYNPQTNWFIPYTSEIIDKSIYRYYFFHFGSMPVGASLEIQENKLNYLFFSVTNLNNHIPIYIEPLSIHTFDNNKSLQDIGGFSLYSDMPTGNPIDYKQTLNCYLGVNNSIISTEYYKNKRFLFCYILIKIKANNQTLYAILSYTFGKSFGTSEPVYLTEEEYKLRLNRDGSAVLASVKGLDFDSIMSYANT